MANSLLTISLITKKALALYRNSNSFVKNIDKQYQSEFGRQNYAIGDTLQIRKPVDYTVRTGPTAVPQNSNEQQITLTVNTYLGVDTQFTSQDRALSIENFADRFLAPMINNLGGGTAAAIMAGIETGGTGGLGGVPNIVNNTSSGINNGTAATISPTAQSFLAAGAYLDSVSCPREGRVVIMSPFTQANTVASFTGLFNPQRKISDQYETGLMGVDTLGFEKFLTDQTTITHQTAAYGALPTVNGANQSGSAITVSALAAPLNLGDIIQFTGVTLANRTTKADAGVLATFVITQPAAIGATVLNIYPPLIAPIAGVSQQYQTVMASPANTAQVLSPVAAGQIYRKNFAFHPTSVTAVWVDLPVDMPGTFSHREQLDGMSMRMVNYYAGTSDVDSWRLDTLFGSLWPRPEWACVVADIAT